ncbi:MAG: DUF3800 domain-containing protein [Phycisphaerae bacterium]
MYLMYVDESGDCGLATQGSPTSYFALSGMVVHELRWLQTLERLIAFRRAIKRDFSVGMKDELHAAEMLGRSSHLPQSLKALRKHQRLSILRNFVNQIAQLTDVSVISVIVDKSNKKNKEQVFEVAWKTLIQRFENTLKYQNFPGPRNADDRGIIFPDNTDGKKLTQFIRQMRRYNPIPNRTGIGFRNYPLVSIVEDPCLRDSKRSYFIQAVDTVVYCLKQFVQPSNYFRKTGAKSYYKRLEPVLCTVASRSDPMGIVRR